MERPTGVTILGVLALVGAGFLVLAGAGLFLVGGALLARFSGRPVGMIGGIGAGVVAVFLLALAVLYAFIGSGLLKLQNWARVTTIVLAGIGTFFNGLALLSSLMHMRSFFTLNHAAFVAIDIWILVYLLQPPIKQTFGVTTGL